MSKRTLIIEKLKNDYCIYFSKTELYKSECAFNSTKLNYKYTIGALEEKLLNNPEQIEEFSDFIKDEYE